MAADNCSSSLLVDPYYFGGHGGPSMDLNAIETEVLARALGASMFPNPEAATAGAYPSSSAFLPCLPSPTISNTSTFTAGATTPASSSSGSPFHHSAPPSPCPAPPPSRPQTGAVASGRISKRKPRRSPSSSSKRTLVIIEADPARFMEMVQQMTGIGTSTVPVTQHQLPATTIQHTSTPQQMFHRTATTQVQLPAAVAPMPTLDTSAGFIDTFSLPQLNQQQIFTAPALLDNPFSFLFPEFDCTDDLPMSVQEFPEQQLLQPKPLTPLFPTLESWSV